MAPPENNLIMSGISIRSFRHLEHQNPSIISEDIGRARSMQQFRIGGGGGVRGSEEQRNSVVLEDRMKVMRVIFHNSPSGFVLFLHLIRVLSVVHLEQYLICDNDISLISLTIDQLYY